MSPRLRKLALGDGDLKVAVRVVETPEDPPSDMAAARRALRVLAGWMVARAREAEEASQARQDPPELATAAPPRKALDFPASKRTPVSR